MDGRRRSSTLAGAFSAMLLLVLGWPAMAAGPVLPAYDHGTIPVPTQFRAPLPRPRTSGRAAGAAEWKVLVVIARNSDFSWPAGTYAGPPPYNWAAGTYKGGFTDQQVASLQASAGKFAQTVDDLSAGLGTGRK